MAGLIAFLAAAALAQSAPGADPVDRWSADIAEASARFEIPEAWIRRVMRAESGGHTMSGGRATVSRAGAMGLMQLMPRTWSEVRQALRLGNDPFDPHDNILAGAFYLRSMYDRFGYPGLFAAYNAGPSRYSDFLAGSRPLPAETRLYARRLAKEGRGERILPGRSSAALFALRRDPDSSPAVRPMEGSGRAGLFVGIGSVASP